MSSRHSLFVGALLAVLIPVRAEKFVLPAVADTSLVEAAPSSNFGKNPRLRVGGELYDGVSVPGKRNHSLLKFDLSSIPSTSKVVAASLKMTVSMDHGGRSVGQVWVFRTLQEWLEGNGTEPSVPTTGNGATWFYKEHRQPWTEPGGKWIADFSYLRSETVNIHEPGIYKFGSAYMAQDLQAWLDQPLSNFGWFFIHSNDDSDSLLYFASREDAQNAPELTVFTGNPDAPRAFLNGDFIDQANLKVDTLVHREVRLESPYPDGHTFFTLDGSKPTLLSTRYERPFPVNAGSTLRAVTYSSDYALGGVEMIPVTFSALPIFPLNFSAAGNGTVHISGPPTTSSGMYSSNSVITLTAVPQPGSIFTGWTGDIQSSETNLTFTLTRPISVQANFVPVQPRVIVRRVQQDFLLVQFETIPTLTYSVQASTDLLTWTEVKLYSNSTGVVDAIFPLDPATPPKFYRVVAISSGSPATPPY